MSLISLLKSNEKKYKGSPSNSVREALGTLATTIPSDSLPVSVESSSWITLEDPNRIVKTFEFSSFETMGYFIDELLAYQEKNSHHALVAINHRIITVETYTHDIDAVTRQDLNLAKFCDEIYEDTKFFNR